MGSRRSSRRCAQASREISAKRADDRAKGYRRDRLGQLAGRRVLQVDLHGLVFVDRGVALVDLAGELFDFGDFLIFLKSYDRPLS